MDIGSASSVERTQANAARDLEQRSDIVRRKAISSMMESLRVIFQLMDENVRVSQLVHPHSETQLTKALGKAIDDRYGNLEDVSAMIDGNIVSELERSIVEFLKEMPKSVESAYRLPRSGPALNYAIQLKEDTIEKENEILVFLEEWEAQKLSARYPIFFRFISAEIAEKLSAFPRLSLS